MKPGEKKESSDDSVMVLGYKLFAKFLKHPEKLTEAEKQKLEDMGINLDTNEQKGGGK